jgi:hypothetical protein
MTAKKAASSRPSLAPKSTRKTEKKRDDDADSGLRVKLDGDIYEVRFGDVSSEVIRELRRHAGFGFNGLAQALKIDPDVDFIAAFVWLARRVAGEDVAFNDVVVTYRQLLEDFDVEAVGSEDVHLGPEA